MPIYEYKCQHCGHEFEELVKVGQTPPCPGCNAADPERQLSLCGISTQHTREVATQSGRRLAGRIRRDKEHADNEYLRKHMEDHH